MFAVRQCNGAYTEEKMCENIRCVGTSDKFSVGFACLRNETLKRGLGGIYE